jgi:hypothetical protein
MSVRSASHPRFESVPSRRTSGGRGLRFLQLPNRAHRERWDHRRERPFKAHLCGYPNSAVFHQTGPGCLPSRVTGFGGAWDAIGGWKEFGQPVDPVFRVQNHPGQNTAPRHLDRPYDHRRLPPPQSSSRRPHPSHSNGVAEVLTIDMYFHRRAIGVPPTLFHLLLRATVCNVHDSSL